MAKKKEPAYAEAIAEIEKILARFRSEEMDVDSLAAEVKRATDSFPERKNWDFRPLIRFWKNMRTTGWRRR